MAVPLPPMSFSGEERGHMCPACEHATLTIKNHKFLWWSWTIWTCSYCRGMGDPKRKEVYPSA